MTHEDDVARALCHAHAAALAVGVVELKAVADSFQHAFRAIGEAKIALVAYAAGQAATCLGSVFEAYVHFVERRASLGDSERIALGYWLALKQVKLHCVSTNNFVTPDINVA